MMKLWLRKIFVILVTIITFGTVVPQFPMDIEENVKENSDVSKQDQQLQVENIPKQEEFEEKSISWLDEAHEIEEEEKLIASFMAYSVEQAEQLSMTKFGSVISPVIGDEFKQMILPKIEEVIAQLANRIEPEELRQLIISENPAHGLGEKIFHVYHKETGKDYIRFHVRRDHPPKEGYWFNFHYHTYEDNYIAHHDLGSIYWDKNTPPYWMST